MKYVSLAYIDEKRFEALTGSEQDAMRDVCFAYIDWLKETGHFVGGELLQSAATRPHCAGRTAECPSPTGRTPRRKSSSGAC